MVNNMGASEKMLAAVEQAKKESQKAMNIFQSYALGIWVFSTGLYFRIYSPSLRPISSSSAVAYLLFLGNIRVLVQKPLLDGRVIRRIGASY